MAKLLTRISRCLLVLAAFFAPEILLAQGYPAKAVRMIVPWPPGGGTDIVARTLAQKMSENMGQQIFIENRPGAAAIIGTDAAAKATPDGYTILMGNLGPNAANAALYKKLPYDVINDFAPITLVANAPYVLAVNPSVPAKSVREFIDLAKKNPGKLNFGTGGIGSPPHLAAELFRLMAGIDMVHVPYKGGSAHTTALIAGEVQMTMNSPLEIFPHVQSGKLRALAISTAERSEIAPELPTLAESGLPGYEFLVWWGLLAPAGTPSEIIEKLHGEAVKALVSADVKDRFTKIGAKGVGDSPKEFAAYIAAERDKWARVAKQGKIPLQ